MLMKLCPSAPDFLPLGRDPGEAMKKFLHKVRGGLPLRSRVAGAIQGVIGDKLPKSMQIEMQFVDADRPSPDVVISRQHVCIFVHGSADTEAGWSVKAPQLNFGQQLLMEFGAAPLYVRYNSGLAVSENGENLAKLLQALLVRHKSVRKLTLIGHSMGGLVIHSAIYHARAQNLAWIKKVRQVFLLGTPHAGAPLAKLAEKGEQILQFIPNPVTLIAASVIGLRSRGLKDLSHGQRGLPAEGKILLPKTRYVFIAGGLQKKPKGIFNKLMGDGMVRHRSAHANAEPATSSAVAWLKKAIPLLSRAARVHVEIVPGANHLALRTSPQVYAVIRRYFSA